MGTYLNPRNDDFQQAVNSDIYVDKTGLLIQTNRFLRTEQRFICVSRPRRFGKSMAANMLTAYYSRGCDSRELFSRFKIAQADSFEKHLNQYNVIRLNISDIMSESATITEAIKSIEQGIISEIEEEISVVKLPQSVNLRIAFEKVFQRMSIPFVFILDEWDCLFRMKQFSNDDQVVYLNFLRNILKDKSYVALAYMTGILPIKKYGEHSALNMFMEISMTDAKPLSEFTGFTEQEVQELCTEYGRDYEMMKQWYDGYSVDGIWLYNPKAVVESILRDEFESYWNSTETYRALKDFIRMNFDGLRDKVKDMIAGEKIQVNPAKFQNDMTSFQSADDVLTLLIHLGYLTYDKKMKTAWIPNSEVQQEFINSIEDGGWEEIMNAIRSSDELIQATLDGDTETVEKLIARSHEENTSILKYNDENSLACVISLAYYTARKNYIMHRELPTGKGFADIVYIPRKHVETPALVIELKHNQPAGTAIEQIKAKNYPTKIAEYTGEIIMVGITYDDDKGHSCVIERYRKG